MYGIFALVVTVDNEIEHVAVFCLYRNELLAAFLAAADIVNEGHISVRCEGVTVAARFFHISKHTAEHIKQPCQHIEINGEGGLAVCVRLRVDGLIRYGEIIGMNVADTFRQKHHDPFAVCADHVHGLAVLKLGKGPVIKTGSRSDVQSGSVCGDGADLSGFCFFLRNITHAADEG